MSLEKFSKTYKPFEHPWAMEVTVKHEEIHWTETELDMADDISDWKLKLAPEQKEFITNILRLFTQSDVQVGQNYYDYLLPIFKNNEVRNMLGSFAAREGTHQRAYALLNDTLGLPDEEFKVFLEYKEMSDKIDFMKDNNTDTAHDRALSLAKSVFSEGVSLFASFAMLLNFQRAGLMKSMCTVVEWSIRDETLHVEGNSRLFREYCNENKYVVNNDLKARIYEMANDVVALEDKFIELAYGDNYEISGLNRFDVCNYIRYLTDRRLVQLGLKPIFEVKTNPIMWLDYIINGTSHDNFFEKRVTEYSVNGMVGEWDWLDVSLGFKGVDS